MKQENRPKKEVSEINDLKKHLNKIDRKIESLHDDVALLNIYLSEGLREIMAKISEPKKSEIDILIDRLRQAAMNLREQTERESRMFL